MKPKLLVVELWGMGDLVIATQFLRAASEQYDVTLLAKPYAQDLQRRFWPKVKVIPFVAPWTAFKRKYRLHRWPWREIVRVLRLRRERFDAGISGRWDPRDHMLLKALGARRRLGFARMGSRIFLTEPLAKPEPRAHRYEYWRVLGSALELELPEREKIPVSPPRPTGEILVHTGAGQPVRVWPLERYRLLVNRLRAQGERVQVACDADQENWWRTAGETGVAAPRTVTELLTLIDRARLFIGNDSGPGHLAACVGVPTFTVFGPQVPEWFAPLHPHARWIEGKACPYRPCSDYCRFAQPICLTRLEEEEVWGKGGF
jgi:ADP-heptose:LPS heptosyltransferase